MVSCQVHAVAMDFNMTSRIACSESKHTCCTFSKGNLMILGALPSFFCKQDLWSWIVAILHDSMLSVMARTCCTSSNAFVHVPGAHGCWPPAPKQRRTPLLHCGSVLVRAERQLNSSSFAVGPRHVHPVPRTLAAIMPRFTLVGICRLVRGIRHFARVV